MVFYKSNFVPGEICEKLKYFLTNHLHLTRKDQVDKWKGRVIPYSKIEDRDIRRMITIVGALACDEIKQFFSLDRLYVHESELVLWRMGDFSQPHQHVAAGREICTYNAVIYLNEDYQGGEIFFPELNKEIKPEKGAIVAFHGREVLHGVKEVKNNIRCSMNLWFSDDVNLIEVP